MRKQFNLQDWLKDKSQKVETRDGRPVKIISFEMTDTNDCPIAAQFRLCAGTPVVYLFDKEGHYKGEGDSDYDLFIITPEPELTEFEQEVYKITTNKVHFKEEANKLLELAKKELCKDCAANLEGYVKGRQDAIKEVEENRPYKYEGPSIPIFWPPCYYGGPCTNPQYDCINCPRRSITVRFNTTTGTSTSKLEG